MITGKNVSSSARAHQPLTRVAHDVYIDLSVLHDLMDSKLVDAPLDAFADICYAQAISKDASSGSSSNNKLSTTLLKPTKSSFDDAQSMFSFLSDEESEEEEVGHSFSYSSSSSSLTDEDDESWLDSPCTTEWIRNEIVGTDARKLKEDAFPAVAAEIRIKDGLAWVSNI
jgi:hypothetical protein